MGRTPSLGFGQVKRAGLKILDIFPIQVLGKWAIAREDPLHGRSAKPDSRRGDWKIWRGGVGSISLAWSPMTPFPVPRHLKSCLHKYPLNHLSGSLGDLGIPEFAVKLDPFTQVFPNQISLAETTKKKTLLREEGLFFSAWGLGLAC